jgi:hypothetical protein
MTACAKLEDAVTGQAVVSLRGAVEILNRVQHDGCEGWYVCGDTIRPGREYDPSLRFTAFEAIAIAEKYIQAISFRRDSSESTHSESSATADPRSHR